MTKREKQVEATRRWRIKHPDHKRVDAIHYLANKEAIKKRHAANHAAVMADPVKRAHRQARMRIANVKRLAEKRDHISKLRSINKKRRREIDPAFVMKMRMHGRIRGALKRVGARRAMRTPVLVGCTYDELKVHIESLFLPGMSWGNRSLWHVDHIRPCASFNLLDPDQQKCCFHYTNLQPLWAEDNISKSDKIA